MIKSILLKVPFIGKKLQEKEKVIERKKNEIEILKEKANNLQNNNLTIRDANSTLLKEINNLKNSIFKLHRYRYKIIIEKLKNKVRLGEKINVCFFVILDSTFAYKPLYEEMLEDGLFNPFIVVIPDISRGDNHMDTNFEKAYSYFSKKYKNVLKGYDVITKKFQDFSNITDLVCYPNPYKGMTHKYFEVEYCLDKDILPFYINYAYTVTNFFEEQIKLDSYNYFWTIFLENKDCLDRLKENQRLNGKNGIVVGYCKMDDLNNQKTIKRIRKRIIIAPHHTITDWKSLQLSNFLKYSDFFLELPMIYPEIDFVFRPHPLLASQLKKPNIWGVEKTNEYFKKIESHPNCTYDEGGDYFDTFVNSDAIIHDCGSFLAEYFYTDKPTCYMLKNKSAIKKWFSPIGQKCLEYSYQAFNQIDILNFINKGIIQEKDILKKDRIIFANSILKINYPNVSKTIISYFKKHIT